MTKMKAVWRFFDTLKFELFSFCQLLLSLDFTFGMIFQFDIGSQIEMDLTAVASSL